MGGVVVSSVLSQLVLLLGFEVFWFCARLETELVCPQLVLPPM